MITPDIYFENVPKTLDMNIRSELYSVNEFTFAVAVILSAQATDKKINEVTPELFRIAPRINLVYSGDDDMLGAVNTHKARIMADALVVDVSVGTANQFDTEIEGHKFAINIQKV